MTPRTMLDVLADDRQMPANRDVQQLTRDLWNVAANTPITADATRDQSRTRTVGRLRSRLGRKAL